MLLSYGKPQSRHQGLSMLTECSMVEASSDTHVSVSYSGDKGPSMFCAAIRCSYAIESTPILGRFTGFICQQLSKTLRSVSRVSVGTCQR